MKKELFEIQSDEYIILKFRKHWIMFLRDTWGTIVAAVVPFFLYLPLKLSGILPAQYDSPSLITFVAALWLLINWCAIAIIWTNYYLDIWIITNHRIVNANQHGLFDRATTTWRLDRVQEVTLEMKNPLQMLLHYGTIEVHTSGPSDEFARIKGVREPEIIQKTISREVDRFMELHYQGRVSSTPPSEDSL